MNQTNNDDQPDPILDACLEELLGHAQPPDLTARILAAWQVRQSAGVSAENASPAVLAHGANGSALDRAMPLIDVSPTAGGGANVRRKCAADGRADRLPLWGICAALMAMLAVGIGLGIAALRFTSAPTQPELAATDIEPQRQNTAAREPNANRPSRSRDLATHNTDEPSQDEVPFAIGPGLNPDQADSGPVKIRTAEWPSPVGEKMLVSLVNHSLTNLWQQHGVQPSVQATDEEWCRRVFVRMIGRIPTVEELNAFATDTSADKYERLVQRLQEEPPYAEQFARHWAVFWANTLIGRTAGTAAADAVDRSALEQYLMDAWLADRPLKEIAYELVGATGANRAGADDFNPAVNFLIAHHAPDGVRATTAVSRVFLGERLQCAQCHDHPDNESIGQQQFWQLNAFFRQMEVQRDAATQAARLVNRDASEDEVYFEQMDGYTRAVYPVLPDGTALPASGAIEEVDRRQVLAQWIAQSPQLPAAVVNRVWAHFFGYGLVQPIDDMGSHNPPVHADLLEQLTEQFAAHNFSLRQLTRWIALSDAFRRSSRVNENNLADAPERGSEPLFSRYYTRQMQPEAVFESLRLVSEARRTGSLTGSDRSNWLGQVMPGRVAEDPVAPSNVGQSLAVMHAPIMQHAVSSERGAVLRRVLESNMSLEEKLEHLFLAAVARKPNANEQQLAQQMISAADRPQTALEDIWWALLNSNEFILDH